MHCADFATTLRPMSITQWGITRAATQEFKWFKWRRDDQLHALLQSRTSSAHAVVHTNEQTIVPRTKEEVNRVSHKLDSFARSPLRCSERRHPWILHSQESNTMMSASDNTCCVMHRASKPITTSPRSSPCSVLSLQRLCTQSAHHTMGSRESLFKRLKNHQMLAGLQLSTPGRRPVVRQETWNQLSTEHVLRLEKYVT